MTKQRSTKFTFAHFVFAFAVLAILSSVGCERRAFYRKQANTEVTMLMDTATCNPEWLLNDFTINIDPRSRYYDPFDPDKEPMPQDDPYSNVFMHCVDGKKGWKKWYENGVTNELQNPGWRSKLSEYMQTEDDKIVLDVDSALFLSILQSPTYQNQLETLYLTAIDVSTERFRLQTQFFGGTDLTQSHLGRERTGVERNTLTADADLQLRRRFATAGELLVGVANSFVWQFTGANSSSAFSIINFNFVQPLLRNGGRVIALETLTIAERTLLANLRTFQRYRQGYYSQIAIGRSGVSSPQRRGGFQGGTGLTGFTGTGAGGIGGVAAGTFGGFGGGGAGGAGGAAVGTGLAGGGAGNVGGFIGLLQSLQEYRNARDSLELQLRTLALLEGNLAAGLIDLTQVDQFRQSIETQRAQLLQVEIGLTNSIENYITGTIGLPPDLAVQLDDSFIKQFQLIDPKMTDFQNDIYTIQDAIGVLPDKDVTPERIRKFASDANNIRMRIEQYYKTIRDDVAKLNQVAPQRERGMDAKEKEAFKNERKELKDALDRFFKRIAESAMDLKKVTDGLNDMNAEDKLGDLVIWLREFLTLEQEILLIQARGRLESVYLDKIELSSEQALQIAKCNRLDWMNNRASLVDTWRLITFNANRLQADLEVRVSGDVRTTGDNITNFQGKNSTLLMGLQYDAPFTRLLERNNYRQSLIDYQRSRRQLIQFEDSVNSNLRQLLRQLEQLEINLEIQRRAVAIAIRRVDFTQAELNKPLPLPVPGQPQPTFGPTAVQNLSSALADLRNSQNNFMSVWLNYYATRMTLMLSLGVMEIDDQGRWVDTKFDVNNYLADGGQDIPGEIPPEYFLPGDQAPESDLGPGANPMGQPIEPKQGKARFRYTSKSSNQKSLKVQSEPKIFSFAKYLNGDSKKLDMRPTYVQRSEAAKQIRQQRMPVAPQSVVRAPGNRSDNAPMERTAEAPRKRIVIIR